MFHAKGQVLMKTVTVAIILKLQYLREYTQFLILIKLDVNILKNSNY